MRITVDYLKKLGKPFDVKIERVNSRVIEVWWKDSCISECSNIDEAYSEMMDYIWQVKEARKNVHCGINSV
jgi:hypothetical protein